jgi:hypothetical protein
MLHLALLARCINNEAVQYSVLTQNCYFFAHVMCEALKELNPEHDLPPTHGKAKRGTWHGLALNVMYNDSGKGMVKKMVETFPDELKTFDSDVGHFPYNPRRHLKHRFTDLPSSQ